MEGGSRRINNKGMCLGNERGKRRKWSSHRNVKGEEGREGRMSRDRNVKVVEEEEEGNRNKSIDCCKCEFY